MIIVASGAAGQRRGRASGVIERGMRRSAPYYADAAQVIVLVGAVTVLSAFIKNIGALAMLMPVAFQIARRTGTSPSAC